MSRNRRVAPVLTLAVAVPLALTMPAVAAAPGVSHLVVTMPGSSTSVTAVAVDMQASPSGVVVDVQLDGNCPAAYGNGQEYGIAAVSSATAVATVTPASVSGYHCGSGPAAFTIVGHSNDVTTLRFDPVAANSGLQKKLRGVSITVTVTHSGTPGDGGPPAAHKRPGAPAVANAYLGSPTVNAACRTHYASAGHHWRGTLISAVARWSAAGKWSTKKNDTTLFPTDNDWIIFVQSKVDSLCS